MGEQFKIPAPDAPAEEWGRLAVSIPGFLLCAGCAVMDDSGARGIVVELGPRWQADNEWWKPQNHGAIGEGFAVFRPGYGLTSLTGWVPDPDDPATAGCLLALLGEDVWRISKGFTHNDWRAVVRDACEPWQEPETGGLPLGRACIAAAAALGRWPGVDHG